MRCRGTLLDSRPDPRRAVDHPDHAGHQERKQRVAKGRQPDGFGSSLIAQIAQARIICDCLESTAEHLAPGPSTVPGAGFFGGCPSSRDMLLQRRHDIGCRTAAHRADVSTRIGLSTTNSVLAKAICGGRRTTFQIRGMRGLSLANNTHGSDSRNLPLLTDAPPTTRGLAPSSKAGRLKWATTSSKPAGSTKTVDRLARRRQRHAARRPTLLWRPSAPRRPRSRARWRRSCRRPRRSSSAIRRRSGAAAAGTEMSRRIALIEQRLPRSGPMLVEPTGPQRVIPVSRLFGVLRPARQCVLGDPDVGIAVTHAAAICSNATDHDHRAARVVLCRVTDRPVGAIDRNPPAALARSGAPAPLRKSR